MHYVLHHAFSILNPLKLFNTFIIIGRCFICCSLFCGCLGKIRVNMRQTIEMSRDGNRIGLPQVDEASKLILNLCEYVFVCVENVKNTFSWLCPSTCCVFSIIFEPKCMARMFEISFHK